MVSGEKKNKRIRRIGRIRRMERHEMDSPSSSDREESRGRFICHVGRSIARNNSKAVALYGLFGLGGLKSFGE